ncbi:hypothetical protein J2X69_002686 [Algoriphagus sp. 4150]|uniref:hypothetical protein n=1 Tax=Algoriphagus sp. 4150 TaxID=2817756 RepID=UPI002866E3D7|nr:hypothetical protein [Algoriphagus sp. 4150]MDR7130336.1 hypothetical protein [Algoriphagus sp. 4150]
MKLFNQTSAKVSLGKRQTEDTDIFNPVNYRAIGIGNWYKQDLEHYEQPSFPVGSIPVQLQLDHCLKAKIHADFLLTFQNNAGYMKALTGIRKTIMQGWYYGDLKSFADGQTITSLVLIQFSPDRSMFRLYMFKSYYPEGSKRINTITKVIQELNITGNPPKQVLQTINQRREIRKQETVSQSFKKTN